MLCASPRCSLSSRLLCRAQTRRNRSKVVHKGTLPPGAVAAVLFACPFVVATSEDAATAGAGGSRPPPQPPARGAAPAARNSGSSSDVWTLATPSTTATLASTTAATRVAAKEAAALEVPACPCGGCCVVSSSLRCFEFCALDAAVHCVCTVVTSYADTVAHWRLRVERLGAVVRMYVLQRPLGHPWRAVMVVVMRCIAAATVVPSPSSLALSQVTLRGPNRKPFSLSQERKVEGLACTLSLYAAAWLVNCTSLPLSVLGSTTEVRSVPTHG